ncbi:unnamed protein product [Microthlaspi erraticum]|uniref:Endonuclease/exonuclease/phosphatase domain-containing protein n=1 Tax=Microthlaspi erraticum TaxID=1685480 RepID=A0A6D2IPK0_9BRAS|nr:unnamed protein product [Microthlaspi erraticum]
MSEGSTGKEPPPATLVGGPSLGETKVKGLGDFAEFSAPGPLSISEEQFTLLTRSSKKKLRKDLRSGTGSSFPKGSLRMIGINKPLLGGILETHVKEDRVEAVLTSVFPGRRFDSNHSFSDTGKILVTWDPEVSVITFKKTAQFILCCVHIPETNSSLCVVFFYAFNLESQRRELWEYISLIRQGSPASFRPWIPFGDFNQIMLSSKHYSLSPYTLPLSGMAEFRDCLEENELANIHSRGVFFTWSNHNPDNPILRKLDKAIAIETWLSTFPDSVAIFDPPGNSNHSPCIVVLSSEEEIRKKRFKYFSFLATYPKFNAVLTEEWQKDICVGSCMFSLGQRLKNAKLRCRALNREGFGNIQHRANEAFSNLEKSSKLY